MGSYQSGNFAQDLEPATIEEATKQHPRLVNTIRVFVPGLTDEQIGRIVGLIEGTCSACLEDSYGCHCWNDE